MSRKSRNNRYPSNPSQGAAGSTNQTNGFRLATQNLNGMTLPVQITGLEDYLQANLGHELQVQLQNRYPRITYVACGMRAVDTTTLLRKVEYSLQARLEDDRQVSFSTEVISELTEAKVKRPETGKGIVLPFEKKMFTAQYEPFYHRTITRVSEALISQLTNMVYLESRDALREQVPSTLAFQASRSLRRAADEIGGVVDQLLKPGVVPQSVLDMLGAIGSSLSEILPRVIAENYSNMEITDLKMVKTDVSGADKIAHKVILSVRVKVFGEMIENEQTVYLIQGIAPGNPPLVTKEAFVWSPFVGNMEPEKTLLERQANIRDWIIDLFLIKLNQTYPTFMTEQNLKYVQLLECQNELRQYPEAPGRVFLAELGHLLYTAKKDDINERVAQIRVYHSVLRARLQNYIEYQLAMDGGKFTVKDVAVGNPVLGADTYAVSAWFEFIPSSGRAFGEGRRDCGIELRVQHDNHPDGNRLARNRDVFMVPTYTWDEGIVDISLKMAESIDQLAKELLVEMTNFYRDLTEPGPPADIASTVQLPIPNEASRELLEEVLDKSRHLHEVFTVQHSFQAQTSHALKPVKVITHDELRQIDAMLNVISLIVESR